MQWSSNKTRSKIRSEIIKNKLLPYMCNECGISEWKGNSLSLHLDHINGINNDNRLDNLRFLCPNCHSQTDTFAGKNINRKNILLQCNGSTFRSGRENIGSNPIKRTNIMKKGYLLWELAV